MNIFSYSMSGTAASGTWKVSGTVEQSFLEPSGDFDMVVDRAKRDGLLKLTCSGPYIISKFSVERVPEA